VDGIAEPYDAIHIAERIHEQLTEPFDLNGHEFSTTASIGIAFSQTGYSRPEDILRDADTAMYRAKSNGKGRHEVFDLEMHARAVEMLTLERDLRRAVERDEIQVYFQPIVSLWDESLVGFEALARWNHSEKGHISPTQFIPVAEETGVIIPLGMKVLRQACLQLRQWEYKYPASRDLTISVNLSAKQFAQPNLVDEVRRTLIETKLAASRLRLEITESVIMGKAQTSIDMLSQLKALGVQLSIDDFGTGYSSLSYLHRFPVDILKIDRSFVSGMGIDKESTGIVETILTLAEKLDKKVVAEGVETAQQLIQLKALACEFGQGYLFSMPIDAETTERLFVSKIDPSRADTSYEGASLAVDAETITSVYAM
jgi:EAL domain-containing protein (putative c-di-GMP-specific phosphodiesterase class I)